MNTITVYSKPACVQCTATYRALEQAGIEYNIIDLSTDDEAVEFVKTLGYLSAPVIVTDTEHWAGFRPDKLKSLRN